jgi:hypothetical protein
LPEAEGQAAASGSPAVAATVVERTAGAAASQTGSTGDCARGASGSSRLGGTEPKERWGRRRSGGLARAGDAESPLQSPEHILSSKTRIANASSITSIYRRVLACLATR